MSNELETWKNETAGMVVVKKFDSQGKLGSQMVGPARTIHLSPAERKINHELAATEELDVFKNGVMQPVRLLDGTEDKAEIASNPNHLSDSDITKLVKGQPKALESKLGEITNPAALQRILEAAKQADASHSAVQRITERLNEVAPSLFDEVSAVSGPQRDATGLKAVTPR